MAGWIYGWALCCTAAGAATGIDPLITRVSTNQPRTLGIAFETKF
jgi:hypothetical protein